MHLLESPHRVDSNEYTQYTIFNIGDSNGYTQYSIFIIKKKTLNYAKIATMGFFPRVSRISLKQPW